MTAIQYPSLIVVTSDFFFDKEADGINILFDEGLQYLHLRKPFAAKDDVMRLLDGIACKYRERIVLHDWHLLADDYGLKGVHINSRNSNCHQQNTGSMSRSCHTFNELKLYMDKYNYLFISPIFNSISKQGYQSAFTPHQLCEARTSGIINRKVIALGGITPASIPDAMQYGFGGVAVTGFVWKNFASNGTAQALVKRFRQLQQSINMV